MTEQETDAFVDRLWEAYTRWIKNERGGTSQGRLAQAIAALSGQGTRQEDISRWLKGRGRPSYEELPATAEALGVRYQWLGFNDGPMTDGGKLAPKYPLADEPPKKESLAPKKRKKG